jgi:2'-5' RNA ligase
MSARQSAIIVPVPAAEPVVARWRELFDPSAARGMPAHITVLYPFLAEPRLTDDVLAPLEALCGAVAPFDVTFTRTGRFPNALYLEPDPSEPIRQLTLAIAGRWPEAQPYGGAFDDVIPHLTVAREVGEKVFAEADAEVSPALPIGAALSEAWLYVSRTDDGRWRPHTRLRFSG